MEFSLEVGRTLVALKKSCLVKRRWKGEEIKDVRVWGGKWMDLCKD